jgi:hypothetical protein
MTHYLALVHDQCTAIAPVERVVAGPHFYMILWLRARQLKHLLSVANNL